MNPVIPDLLNYLDDGGPSIRLSKAISELGPIEIRTILIHLCSWLKRRSRLRTDRPMEISRESFLNEQLPRFLALCPDLADVLAISEYQIDFKDDVPSEERMEICELVDAKYNPALRD